MRKIILLLVIITSTTMLKAQTGVRDTLSYLQSIVDNKTQYIGQPFSMLQSSLQIQVKFFSAFASLPYDKTKETSTSFAFYFPLSTADHYLSYPRLKVTWQVPLDANQSQVLWQNNNGAWSAAVAAYYSSAVVLDIKVVE